MSLLQTLLAETAYHDYVYSYPHKTAYRSLSPEVDLRSIWQREALHSLSLYLHVPFCEMRCGFCNLFTTVEGKHIGHEPFVGALERQARVMNDLLPDRGFGVVAIGGGTPTILEPELLGRVLQVAKSLGARLADVPVSVETSPATATREKLQLLRTAGVDRVSIGVQSFDEELNVRLKRRQDEVELRRALANIANQAYPVFNIDLMYGIPGQQSEDLLRSIDLAIDAGANELYLYPLYVRPLTGLHTVTEQLADRDSCYVTGRDHLLALGWQQCSMRRFRALDAPEVVMDHQCQRDGRLGLGVGARSYTDRLHYSHEYAVRAGNIRDIIAAYCSADEASFAVANHGFRLDDGERKRRYLILSLLDGVVTGADYVDRFGNSLEQDFPELRELEELERVRYVDGEAQLTSAGLAHSDTIGHWLFSDHVRWLMSEHEAE